MTSLCAAARRQPGKNPKPPFRFDLISKNLFLPPHHAILIFDHRHYFEHSQSKQQPSLEHNNISIIYNIQYPIETKTIIINSD